MLIWRCEQDGEVGRPCAHLLPQEYQNYNYLQSNYLWEWPKDWQKRFSTTKDMKKEPQRDGWEEWSQYSQDPHPRVTTHKQKDNNDYRGSPQGVRGLSPTLGSFAWGSCTGMMSPQNFWLWSPAGLVWGKAGGLWKTETVLKGLTKNLTCSETPHRGSNLKNISF